MKPGKREEAQATRADRLTRAALAVLAAAVAVVSLLFGLGPVAVRGGVEAATINEGNKL
jgi:hypothetical protein